MRWPNHVRPEDIPTNPESIQAYLEQISLDGTVPAEVRKQFAVVKRLCLHACFVQEFWTVSNLVALIAVESALRHRFTQYYEGRFVLTKGSQAETLEGNFESLRFRVSRGWKLVDWPEFHATLQSLVRWAARKGLLGELAHMAKTSIPRLRNAMAHPDFQEVVPAGMALTAVRTCAEITNELFASSNKGQQTDR